MGEVLAGILTAFVAALLLFAAVFFIAKSRDRFDIIDIAWGMAFIAIAITSFLTQPGGIKLFSVQTLVTFLVCIWGYRLSRHIAKRWEQSDQEDGRYRDLRKQYLAKSGGLLMNMFLRVYVVQALLAVVISSSVIVVTAVAPIAVNAIAILGLIVWLVGFYFEAVGDAQLRQFLTEPGNRGQLMMRGLWRYTRHPNYFGEMLQWWGIFIISLSVPVFWWLSIIGPMTITILLLFVSGVPLTEKRFAGRPGWDEYKRRTSKLFPLPPRP